MPGYGFNLSARSSAIHMGQTLLLAHTKVAQPMQGAFRPRIDPWSIPHRVRMPDGPAKRPGKPFTPPQIPVFTIKLISGDRYVFFKLNSYKLGWCYLNRFKQNQKHYRQFKTVMLVQPRRQRWVEEYTNCNCNILPNEGNGYESKLSDSNTPVLDFWEICIISS